MGNFIQIAYFSQPKPQVAAFKGMNARKRLLLLEKIVLIS